MPANIVPADQAAKVADWLSKKNKVLYDKPLLMQRACFSIFSKNTMNDRAVNCCYGLATTTINSLSWRQTDKRRSNGNT